MTYVGKRNTLGRRRSSAVRYIAASRRAAHNARHNRDDQKSNHLRWMNVYTPKATLMRMGCERYGRVSNRASDFKQKVNSLTSAHFCTYALIDKREGFSLVIIQKGESAESRVNNAND